MQKQKRSEKWVRRDLMRLLAYCVFNYRVFVLISSCGEEGRSRKDKFFSGIANYIGSKRTCEAVRQFFCRKQGKKRNKNNYFVILKKNEENHLAFRNSAKELKSPVCDLENEKLINNYLVNLFPNEFSILKNDDVKWPIEIESKNDLIFSLMSQFSESIINTKITNKITKELENPLSIESLDKIELEILELENEIPLRIRQIKEANRYLCQVVIFDR